MVRILAGLVLLSGAAAISAQPPPAVDTKVIDKTIVATLRDIHDRGADLYNLSKDYSATYHLYEGSLLVVRPLLMHRSDVQKAIDDGLIVAAKETDSARKAFVLHETIEKVRADLKAPVLVKPSIEPKKTEPMPKPKPKDMEPAPMPKPKEPKAEGATVSGKVTVQGKALAEGTVTFVSLDQKAPKVDNATVKDGTYTMKDLPPGKYAVAISSKTAGAVPMKFATTDTSGLRYQPLAGKNQFDIELK
jgi:hypothetical protein